MHMKRLLLLVLLLGLCGPVTAQYIIKEADAKYDLFDYHKAIDLYEQAYRKKRTLHAAERLAHCYSFLKNYKETESWYAIATGLAGSAPENMLYYAEALQNNGKYNEAKATYIKYASLNARVTPEQKNRWVSGCDSALVWMKTPRHVLITNVNQVNTSKSDWGAVAYGEDLVFASDRIDMPRNNSTKQDRPFLKFDIGETPSRDIYAWTGNAYTNLYLQRHKEGDVNYFPATIKTDYHIGPASFTADGKEMYFMMTRIPSRSVFDKKAVLRTINVEIYSCRKDDSGQWGVPMAFKYNQVAVYSVGDPCISKDGKTVYFVSNMPGGKGGTDIYYCKRNATGEWDNPVNLSDLNTEGNERTPSFDSADNFYFSSDGLIGMGGLDIYKSAIVDGVFSKAINKGYPLNSPQDDFAYNFDGLVTGYFASNRPEGHGSDDIYRFSDQRKVLYKLEGVAYEKNNHQPLPNVLISFQRFEGTSLKIQTDTNGRFNFDVDSGFQYTLRGEKAGFRSDTANISTENFNANTLLRKDLELEKITLNQEIVFKNIYYDFNKWDIRPDAALELDKLMMVLQNNPTMWIDIGSHTDSRGSEQYNLWLSQKRADAVVQYLLKRGVNKNRLDAKGFGETMLINKCSKGIKCTEAEQQLNRRTTFTILKY